FTIHQQQSDNDGREDDDGKRVGRRRSEHRLVRIIPDTQREGSEADWREEERDRKLLHRRQEDERHAYHQPAPKQRERAFEKGPERRSSEGARRLLNGRGRLIEG